MKQWKRLGMAVALSVACGASGMALPAAAQRRCEREAGHQLSELG